MFSGEVSIIGVTLEDVAGFFNTVQEIGGSVDDVEFTTQQKPLG